MLWILEKILWKNWHTEEFESILGPKTHYIIMFLHLKQCDTWWHIFPSPDEVRTIFKLFFQDLNHDFSKW